MAAQSPDQPGQEKWAGLMLQGLSQGPTRGHRAERGGTGVTGLWVGSQGGECLLADRRSSTLGGWCLWGSQKLFR